MGNKTVKSHGFIFARGGSKGLPRKNIKLLAGKPLINYSIEIAKQVASLDCVFVSTDDPEIAEVAKSAGAIVIDRPAELATDSSAEWHSWRHAVAWVTDNYGKFDQFVSLPVTSPLRSVADVEAAMAKLEATGADICISMTSASRSPYFNMVQKNDAGFVELLMKPKSQIVRRQDAPEIFDVTTVVYVTTPEFIEKKSGVYEGKVTSIEVPKVRAVDIDDIYDFKLAEAILNEQD